MAFKRSTSRTFRTLVKVPVANDNGGYDINDFTAIFLHADTKQLEALRGLTNDELLRGKNLHLELGHADRIEGRLAGWVMKDGETGEDVPFTPENLEAALRIPPTALFTASAFWEAINGARAKNL